MQYVLQILLDNLPVILTTIITAITGYIGIKVKKFINNKNKERIIEKTVGYVEQMNNNRKKNNEPSWTSDEKKEQCKIKAMEWLSVEGLSVADVELDILIESAVNKVYGKK